MGDSQRLTISTLILTGYLLILFFFLGLGWFAARNMERLQTISLDLYTHPFAVSNAAQEIKISLFELRNLVLRIVFFRHKDDDVHRLFAEEREFEKSVRADLVIIKENFLGDMDRVKELENKLDEWNTIRSEIIATAKNGDLVTAEQLVRTIGTPKFEELVPLVDYVLNFAKNKGKYFANQAQNSASRIINQMRMLIAFIVFSFAIGGLILLKRARNLEIALCAQATTDFLTAIPNRRHFIEVAGQEFARAKRYNEVFSLATADLDFFKVINDTHGHNIGDHVLKRFCEICMKNLRTSDTIGRIGGEEFAILLPKTNLTEAQTFLERVRRGIEETRLVEENLTTIQFTASFGFTVFSSEDKDMETLFLRADNALYEAKHSGRNRICCKF